MTHVVVLAGGISDERAVSIRSGKAVTTALTEANYQTSILDPLILDERFTEQIMTADAVFPALHGIGGEDGAIQRWMDDRGIRYVGSNANSSELCFDKWKYKQCLIQEELSVAAGNLVDKDSFWESQLASGPFVLKPYDGGSSVDTYIVRNIADITEAGGSNGRNALVAAFGRHPKMLLERLVEGTEITVGILGEEALPVIEIIPPTDGEFDYENKYNGRTQELCPPQSVSLEIQTQAQELALRIHHLAGCRDMSRTDMIVTSDNQLIVLETNTIPGLTTQSLLPKAAAEAGYTMPQFVDRLVVACLKR